MPLPHHWLAILGLLIMSSASANEPRSGIVIAPTLFDSTPDEIRAQAGLADLVQEATGRSVSVATHNDYQHIMQGFIDNEIDLTILGPLPAVRLLQAAPETRPLVRFLEPNGSRFFRCSLIGFHEDLPPVADPDKPLQLALTQPLSTCGYFAASNTFEKLGLDIDAAQYDFLNRHDAIAISVVVGRHDLGVVREEIAKRFTNLGIEIIANTIDLPGFTLLANSQTLTDEDIQALKAAFLELDKQTLAEKTHWPRHLRHGVRPAQQSDYDEIQAIFQQTDFPEALIEIVQ